MNEQIPEQHQPVAPVEQAAQQLLACSPSPAAGQQQQQHAAAVLTTSSAATPTPTPPTPANLDGAPAHGSAQHLLPYGATLHYPGCSCPPGWQRGARVADQVDRLVLKAHGLCEQGLIAPQRRLRVCYMLPHHNITGGMKCLVEHIRLLRARGHFTIAAHRSDSATRAMPPWTTVEADADVVCKLHQRLSDVYPVHDIDVVLVGIFHQVAELLAGVPVPVIYWEQGHEWLFGDPIRLQTAQNYLAQDQLFHTILHLPVVLAGVSSAVQDILQHEFGRGSLLIPNGVDCERFQPGPLHELDASGGLVAISSGGGAAAAAAAAGGGAADDSAGDAAAAAEAAGGAAARAVAVAGGSDAAAAAGELAGTPAAAGVVAIKRVLLVGNPALPLKGFPTAIAALVAVAALVPMKVRWVCQVEPTPAMVPGLQGCGLDLERIVNPKQAQLPALYKGHDALLFTSRYEAWGMPVLEGMATGLPVVTTDCLGIRTFCRHGENCLVAPTDDAATLAQHLLLVLTEPTLAASLSDAARSTALQYTPEKVAEHLESVLYCLTAVGPELLQLRQGCLLELQAACARASEACSRPSAAQQHQQQQRQRQLQAQQLQLAQQQLLLQAGQQHTAQYQLQSLRVEQLELATPQRVLQLQHPQQQQQLLLLQPLDASPLQLSMLMPFLLQQHQQQHTALLTSLLQSSGALRSPALQHNTPAAAILLQQQQQMQQQPVTSLFQQFSHHLPTPLAQLTQQQVVAVSQQLSQQQLMVAPHLQLPLLTSAEQQLVAHSQQMVSQQLAPPAAPLQLLLQQLGGQQQQQQQGLLMPPSSSQQHLAALQLQQHAVALAAFQQQQQQQQQAFPLNPLFN